MSAILLSSDLACSSKVSGAASQAGFSLAVAMSPAALLDKAAGCRLVLLDLNSPGVDPGELVPELRALQPPPDVIVAFGPHVHELKLNAARDAECDEVLTRGQFHNQQAELLRRYLTT